MISSGSESKILINANLFSPDLDTSQIGEKILWPALHDGGDLEFNPDLSNLEYLSQLLDDSTSNLSKAFASSPSITSQKITWGDSYTGIIIDWEPQYRFDTLDGIKRAIEAGVENGVINGISFINNAKTLLTLTITNNNIELVTGDLSLRLDGKWDRGFQDLLEFASKLNEITPGLFDQESMELLYNYGFYGFSLFQGNQEWGNVTFNENQIGLTIAGASLTVNGNFPLSSIGELLEFDAYLDGVSYPIVNYDQLNGYFLDNIEIRNDLGVILVGVYPGNAPFGVEFFDKFVIEGDESSNIVDISHLGFGADVNTSDLILNSDYQSASVDLKGGDDNLFASDGVSLVADMGDGADTVVFNGSLSNYAVAVTDLGVWVRNNFSQEVDYLTNTEWFEFDDIRLSLNQMIDISSRNQGELISAQSKLTAVIDANVLGDMPMVLEGLNETITTWYGIQIAHTVEYAGLEFNYAQIDKMIMSAVRDGEFTTEFKEEIADFVPSIAEMTYKDAIALVGIADINEIILTVAGADGYYVA
jgi:hypothetical protein